MIRKFLCWLGKHEYRTIKDVREFYNKYCPSCEFYRGDCTCYLCYKNFGKDKKICKHCGKIKKE